MLRRHSELYREATFHPFLQSIRNRSIDFNCFKCWPGQDYIFVREFMRFIASVLLKAPKDAEHGDIDIILGGLAALDQNISWFRKEASKWEVNLVSVNPQKTNREYCRFLESLIEPKVEYAVVITALWAVEVVYCGSFVIYLESDAKTHPKLFEACHRQGNIEFKQYYNSFHKIADSALENASHDV